MKTILAALVFALAISSTPGLARSGEWTVHFENRNITGLANPLPAGPGFLIDATAVGPVLGIMISQDESGFSIHDVEGDLWRWENDSGSLVSSTGFLPMPVPGLQQGSSLFLSAETIAELSHLQLAADEDARQVRFTRSSAEQHTETAERPSNDIEGGWRSFTVPKNASPTKTAAKLPKALAQKLPSSRERIDVGMGFGYVQNADWGILATARGKVAGGSTNLSTFITQGDKGSRLRTSHLTWVNKSTGTAVEMGDLYSEAWGLVRGARYSWDNDPLRSLGIYLKTSNTQNPRALVTYRDSVAISPNLTVQGEIGSDTSAYANASFKVGRMECLGFHRRLPDDLGESTGIFASLALTRNLSLFSGMDMVADSHRHISRSETLGLRFPVYKGCNLVLQQTSRQRDQSSLTSRSIGLTIPVARSMHVYVRYQQNSSARDFFAGQLLSFSSETSNLLTSLSLAVNPRIRLNYQLSRQSYGGQSVNRGQLITNYRLSPTTSLQAFSGFPNVGDMNLLRLRLDHKLTNDTSLLLDYGRLASYQSADDTQGKRGFTFMLQKKWPCWVPAQGGKIDGTISDHLGQPLSGISVRLGDYVAVSDSQGHYSFRCVPPGNYPITIARESIPADYKATSAAKELLVSDDTDTRIDFSLVPLASIFGRVYIDKNGNQSCDPGEGVAGIAVSANDQVTSSNKDGIFGYYNLEPGTYKLGVVGETLGKTYKLQGPREIRVELGPGESITDLEFHLEEQKKPVIFTTVLYSTE